MELVGQHVPVLLDEVVRSLAESEHVRRARSPIRFFDGTLGGAGHASAILRRLPGASLLACDRDPFAIRRARAVLAELGPRVAVVEGSFGAIESVLERAPAGFFADAPGFDGMLLDLGVSSFQFDDPGRGFSFAKDGPLDMRMGGTELTAAELLNGSTVEELQEIFLAGGVPQPFNRGLAREIVRRRPLETTSQLAAICVDVLSVREHRRRDKGRSRGQHPATVPFQALRIAVNDELQELGRFLEHAVDLLVPGGRLAIISFHSLEDQMVTQTMRRWSRAEGLPRELRHAIDSRPQGKLLTPDAVTPGELELDANPRARSARMRVFERW